MSKKLNVLCVEDDLIVADYISSLLDKNKYRVKKINDGKKALDFILSGSEHIDIILLDYYLPSLDGIQILQKLRLNAIAYPVIFLTVDETLETAVRAMKEGAIDYLPKSNFLKAELNLKIERAYQLFFDRKKSEVYEEQLSLLSMAVEQSPASVVITDVDGKITYVNRTFTEYTGYDFEEVKGKSPGILKTNSYKEGFFESLWRTIASGRIWKGEFTNRKKNGEIFYEKASIAPISDKKGNIISYLGINEDITELKKIEQLLLRKNEEMNRFFAVVIDLLCIVDNNTGAILRINSAWEDAFGYSTDEMIGKTFLEFMHPDDIAITTIAYNDLMNHGRVQNFVNRYRCKDGNYKFVEWSVIRNTDGTSYGSARDITDRKRSEMALKDSETKFRTIFEMTNAAIFFSDKNGQIIIANQSFREMVGFSFEELYWMDFTHFTHLDDLQKENELLKQLLKSDIQQYRLVKRYVTKTNKIIWVDIAMSVIRAETGEPYYYVGVVNDVSESKLYAEHLQNINVNKDKLFRIISHDLKNMFSGIHGLSELMIAKKDTLSNETTERYIRMLYNGGRSAMNLLENLLEWSRVQLNKLEHNPENVKLKILLFDIFDTVASQAAIKQIKISFEVNNDHEIFGDKKMVATVIRNLLNNAIKYTPLNGEIVVSSWREKTKDYIAVKDNGIGMKPEKVDELFKLETVRSSLGTDKEKGSGLGLIFCNEFVAIHGGKILVESAPGKGSKFIVELPCGEK
jgi:PAS domain S-box-containing protein